MGQYNIYAADDELNIDVNVEPLTLDTLENSKTAAEASAETARQCAETATEALNDITDYKNSLELYYAQASDNLTTLLNNSLASLNFSKQGIQTLGNTVLSSINSAYNSIVEYIQTLGQGYVNQAKYYADEARDTVDNRVSLEHLNQSKALETGDVSDDSAVLHQLNRFVCSTFDNTKFTVVGSPVITADGIASGFSGSNYLTINTTGFFDDAYKFEVDSCAIYTSDTTEQQEIWEVEWKLRGRINYRSNKHYFDFYVPNGTTFKNTTVALEDLGFTDGDKIYSKCISNGLSSRTLMISKDGENWHTITNTDTVTAGISGITTNTMKIGWYSSTVWWLTSIDLKQFSITVDGVEVFSGNKTGIDTIKPDDYTVVGTPTISADGVASGFSENNYIRRTLNQITQPFKLFFSFTTPSTFSRQTVFSLNSGWHASNIFIINNQLWCDMKFTDTSETGDKQLLTNITGNTKYYGCLEFTGTVLNSYISVNKENLFDTAIKIADTTYPPIINALNIGLIPNIGDYYIYKNGSIDLNSFKIYVDGNLVYQPCLKIPYTEAGNGKGYNASTGSKIVQSIYRDRVSDMYEQFGYAPYYTLSESDFTLPMGELYGMIENLRKLIIDRTTQAGV